MTLSDLSSIVGVISGLAVLGSLIYLAQQTRQNAKHTRALIQQGRAVQSIDMLLRIAEDSSLSDVGSRGNAGDTTLDRAQINQYFSFRVSGFINWEDQFYQHHDGLLNDDRFSAFVRTVETQFQSPGVRCLWKVSRTHTGKEFQSFMDEIMNRTRVVAMPTDLVAVWKAGIEAELSDASA